MPCLWKNLQESLCKCGKRNHFGKKNDFANVCQSSPPKRIHQLEDNNSASEQFFRIGALSKSSNPRTTEQLIAEDQSSVKHRIAFTLDTGAEVNVLPKNFCDKMCLKLDTAHVKLAGFGQNIVRPCGKVLLKCLDKNDVCHELTLYVSDAINHAILGDNACFDLNLLKRVTVCNDIKSDPVLAFSTACRLLNMLICSQTMGCMKKNIISQLNQMR